MYNVQEFKYSIKQNKGLVDYPTQSWVSNMWIWMGGSGINFSGIQFSGIHIRFARICRLVCVFVHKSLKTGLLTSRPNCKWEELLATTLTEF